MILYITPKEHCTNWSHFKALHGEHAAFIVSGFGAAQLEKTTVEE